jgi:uncharacterized protein (DUF952 family)
MDHLFHIARSDDWQAAQPAGVYTVSSLGRQLEEEGFIHMSFSHQVKTVADVVYNGMTGLVLLQIDPARLNAPVVVEALGDAVEPFPHLYGALNTDAVMAVRDYEPQTDGTFTPVTPPRV